MDPHAATPEHPPVAFEAHVAVRAFSPQHVFVRRSQGTPAHRGGVYPPELLPEDEPLLEPLLDEPLLEPLLDEPLLEPLLDEPLLEPLLDEPLEPPSSDASSPDDDPLLDPLLEEPLLEPPDEPPLEPSSPEDEPLLDEPPSVASVAPSTVASPELAPDDDPPLDPSSPDGDAPLLELEDELPLPPVVTRVVAGAGVPASFVGAGVTVAEPPHPEIREGAKTTAGAANTTSARRPFDKRADMANTPPIDLAL